MSRATGLLLAAVVCGAVLLTGCTQASQPQPSPSAAEQSAPAPSGDGVLTIGTLLPTTGSVAYIAPAQRAGVELAVADLNAAGGILGADVVAIHRNSGDAADSVAEESMAALVDEGADVVVGPSSSVLAERLLPAVRDAPVMMISPAASSPTLSALEDDGLLARTVPSAVLQGAALAQALTAEGATRIALIQFEDATSSTIAARFAESLPEEQELVADVKFSADSAPGEVVAEAADAAPDAVVLMSPFAATSVTKAVITALTAAGLGGPRLWFISANLADYSQALPAGTLTGARGVLEGAPADDAFVARVRAIDDSVTDFRFAAEAYDAAVLAALAAEVAGDDGAASIAFTVRGVSGGGIRCLSVTECLGVLRAGGDPDYDGLTGPIALDADGDPTISHYGVYSYDAENRFTRTGDLLVG